MKYEIKQVCVCGRETSYDRGVGTKGSHICSRDLRTKSSLVEPRFEMFEVWKGGLEWSESRARGVVFSAP